MSMQESAAAKRIDNLLGRPGSPNWYWQQLGYTVERPVIIHRITGLPTEHRARIIRRPDGSVVNIPKTEDNHAAEIAAAQGESHAV